MERFVLPSHQRPAQYSTFRQIALLTQSLRDVSGNQRINNPFQDDEATGAELEQGGQLDLSWEEDDLELNDGATSVDRDSITNVTHSTNHEHSDFNNSTEYGFDGQNKRRVNNYQSPIIKQEVSIYTQHQFVKEKYSIIF